MSSRKSSMGAAGGHHDVRQGGKNAGGGPRDSRPISDPEWQRRAAEDVAGVLVDTGYGQHPQQLAKDMPRLNSSEFKVNKDWKKFLFSLQFTSTSPS